MSSSVHTPFKTIEDLQSFLRTKGAPLFAWYLRAIVHHGADGSVLPEDLRKQCLDKAIELLDDVVFEEYLFEVGVPLQEQRISARFLHLETKSSTIANGEIQLQATFYSFSPFAKEFVEKLLETPRKMFDNHFANNRPEGSPKPALLLFLSKLFPNECL